MLNFGASKPRVKGGPDPRGPPGSAPVLVYSLHGTCANQVFHTRIEAHFKP